MPRTFSESQAATQGSSMKYFDQLTDLMLENHCEAMMVGVGVEFFMERPDGTRVPVTASLGPGEIIEALREIVPSHLQAVLNTGASFQFWHERDGRPVSVAFTGPTSNPRVRLSLRDTQAAHSEPPLPRPTPEQRNSSVRVAEQGWSGSSAGTAGSGRALALPAVPLSLQLSERVWRILAGLCGVSAGIGLAAFLANGQHGRVLSQMFDQHNPTTAVPVLINCFFFWGAAICGYRWLRLRQLERLSSTRLLSAVSGSLAQRSIGDTIGDLEQPVVSVSPLLRRLHAVLRQWQLEPKLQAADIVLQEHVAHDQEEVQAGYSLVRTLVWALPVLGLIGTVIGIALAVGGFATFLGGDVEDVRVVKKHLVEVTSGLSFAFVITLQGLLTSLLVMLVASALQTREDRLYGRVQHEISEQFLPELQRSGEAEGVTSGHALGDWTQVVERMAGGVAGAVRQVLEEQDRGRRKELVDLADSMRAVGQQIEAQVNLIGKVAGAVTELNRSTQLAVGALAPVHDGLQKTGAYVAQLGNVLNAVHTGQQGLAHSMEQFGATLAQWRSDGAAQNLTLTLREVSASLSKLGPVLNGFQGPFVLQAVPVNDQPRR